MTCFIAIHAYFGGPESDLHYLRGLPVPSHEMLSLFFVCLFLRFYLFTFRERGREGEKEKNINIREIHRLVASCRPPTKGPGLQPRHVP